MLLALDTFSLFLLRGWQKITYVETGLAGDDGFARSSREHLRVCRRDVSLAWGCETEMAAGPLVLSL